MIAKWVIVGWIIVACLILIGSIGKPRGVLKPSTAVFAVIVNAAELVAILLWWRS